MSTDHRNGHSLVVNRLLAVVAILFAATALQFVGVNVANAAAHGTVMVNTQRMSDATLKSTQSGWYKKGASLTLVCYKRGQSVQGYYSPYIGNGGWDNLWYKVSDGYYVADVDLNTGSNSPITPKCATTPIAKYDRGFAALIATQEYKTVFYPLIANCTIFASYVLFRGGIPETPVWTDSSTDTSQLTSPDFLNPGPTRRWAIADYLKNYIVNEAHLGTITEVSLASKNPGAQLGDLIMYDWGSKPDGIVDHVAVVTGVASDGTLTVTQMTPGQLNRKWNWSDEANTSIAVDRPGTRAYVIHITY